MHVCHQSLGKWLQVSFKPLTIFCQYKNSNGYTFELDINVICSDSMDLLLTHLQCCLSQDLFTNM